jgi:hypothetical protein
MSMTTTTLNTYDDDGRLVCQTITEGPTPEPTVDLKLRIAHALMEQATGPFQVIRPARRSRCGLLGYVLRTDRG